MASRPYVVASKRHGGWCLYWTYVQLLPRPLQIDEEDRLRFRELNAFRPDLSHLSGSPPPPAPANEAFRPREYQLRGAFAAFRQRRLLLADEMGLGKTWQSLAAMVHAGLPDPARPVLVVCPSSLRWQWRSEAARMFLRPDGSGEPLWHPEIVRVIDGGPKRRKEMFQQEPLPLTIVSYETLRNEVEGLRRHFLKRPPFALICDESGKFKSANGVLFAALTTLRAAWKPTYVIALNATPLENRVHELWSQLAVVEPMLFPSEAAFEMRYVEYRTGVARGSGTAYRVIAGYRNVSELRGLIRDRVVRRTCAEVAAELPAVNFVQLPVEAGSAQARAVDAAAEITKERRRNRRPGDGVLGRTHEAVAALYVEVDGKVESAKLDAIPGLLADIGDEQAVFVADNHRFCDLLVARIRAHFARDMQAGLFDGQKAAPVVAAITSGTSDAERERIVRDLRAGVVRYLVGTSAIERGLNLQCASVLVNCDLPWNPARLMQRIGRVRRIGSRHDSVRVINMVLRDSIDAVVLERVYQKQDLFAKLFTLGAGFFAGREEDDAFWENQI